MSPLRSTPGSAAIAAVVLCAALMLSGCSLLPSIPTLGGGGSTSEPTGGDDDSLEEELEENPFIAQTMPANFPAEVPVPDLEILLALDLGTGWTIGYKAEDAVGAFTELADRFAAEGWEELSRVASSDQAFAAYDSADYQVQLNAATVDTGFDSPVLSITVVRKD